MHRGQWLPFKALAVDRMALANPSLHPWLLLLPKGRIYREVFAEALPFVRDRGKQLHLKHSKLETLHELRNKRMSALSVFQSTF